MRAIFILQNTGENANYNAITCIFTGCFTTLS